ncbi:flagellar biosynthesis protein FlhF [Leptospira sp. GIMC2001]|uniref:flagellar biosynthesis protein FlhF n=1 Tax=Leptospira sp. GIMC2001 TaxID=1513297 RepID=UPI0004A5C491|nr:flagellar biosynthesis protein FlhF [Leptospira sp. GIMC2001]AID56235.1 flagellar biosynthesis protein FlhF [Leptospira sp. GIMC2001]WCL48269.1 flagellar biosynthesis protein FlhF [Leptospira sp. GIMC2001]
MDYKKIRGKDFQDCLMQMKMKYGPDAHVYEHRMITEGGLFGTGLLANKMYEIDIAIPEKASSKERVEKKLNDLRELLEKKKVRPSSQVTARRSLDELPQFSKPKSNLRETESKQIARSATLQRREAAQLDLLNEYSSDEDFSNKDESSHNWNHDSSKIPVIETEELTHESGISFQKEIISKDHKSISPALEKLKNKFIQEGFSAGYLEEILPEIEMHLSPIERSRVSSVWEKAVEILENRIKVDSDLFSGTKRGKRKVVFIVGPTGSGKTTTVAKLAAKYFLHMGKTVSLYTTDNYRIAAVEQLKRYADTMDLPFFAAKDVRKFREALLRDGSELVLVDTAGYSHKDRETLYKMKEYYAALGDKDQLESILVLPATVSTHNAREVLKSYEELGFNRIILSKIDEADYLGSYIELADTHHKEYAYFSVGQDVPFDILGAERKLLAECVVYPEKLKGMSGEVYTARS